MATNQDGIEAGKMLSPKELQAAKAQIRAKSQRKKPGPKPKQDQSPE